MTSFDYKENNPFKALGIDQAKISEEAIEKIIYDVYIPMRDGVKIAATISLPKKLPPSKKIPTFLSQSCYWRAMKLRIPFRWFFEELPLSAMVSNIFINRNFATISVDVRGTGASFGTRTFPFSEEEINDGVEIVNWIVSQPWSDGSIVSMGGSYLGTAAEFLASKNHPAVKAVILGHCAWDAYLDGAAPGGCYNNTFMQMWSISGKYQDQNSPKMFRKNLPLFWLLIKGVKPVASNTRLLEEALQEHSSNQYVYDLTRDFNFRDDKLPDGNPVDYISPYYYKEQLEKLNIPIIGWCSWLDSGYVDVVINRFINLKNPQIGILGDWNHGAAMPANQFFPDRKTVSPSLKELLTAWLNFFELCVRGEGIRGKALFYYTMVEEKWKKTSTWPPAGHTMQRWYLTENNGLSVTMPQIESGAADDYEINFRASSGIFNRWWALMGFPLIYGNRAKADKKLLTYTSAPFKQAVEITGNAIVSFYLSSTHEDGVIYVYLEDIDEQSNVTYITDGHLRLIHRKISNDKPPYKTLIPYHTFKKKDALPLVPGEIAEIKFGLHATSVVIRKGHGIRIAIAGHDKDTFNRYPPEGDPTITISHNKEYASYIDIPVIQKKNS